MCLGEAWLPKRSWESIERLTQRGGLERFTLPTILADLADAMQIRQNAGSQLDPVLEGKFMAVIRKTGENAPKGPQLENSSSKTE